VASPHKEAVLSLADEISPTSRRAGAANVFVPDGGGGWRATTTDASGTLELLRDHRVEPRGAAAAVFGCGGSGRAIAAALQDAGWDVVLVNRGAARAALARTLLHLPFVPQTEFRANGHAIVVNATPVGTGANDGSLPFDVAGLRPDAIVIDLPYGSRTTPLVSAARGRGLLAIDGRQMLLAQVPQQFELMTGTPMPAGLAERALAAKDDAGLGAPADASAAPADAPPAAADPTSGPAVTRGRRDAPRLRVGS
jgi:shikimate 5-dehydrogenase